MCCDLLHGVICLLTERFIIHSFRIKMMFLERLGLNIWKVHNSSMISGLLAIGKSSSSGINSFFGRMLFLRIQIGRLKYFGKHRVLTRSLSHYIHRLNPESTAMKPRVQTFKDNIVAASAIDDFIQSVNMPEACKKACYKRIKNSILSFIRISRNYPVAISLDCLPGIRPRLLSDTLLYDLSLIERLKFLLLRYCPIMIVVPVRYLVLTKRFVLKCLKR